MSIKIGILGYGNLGKGVELAVKNNPDMELIAVFTRRNPASVKTLTNFSHETAQVALRLVLFFAFVLILAAKKTS